MITVNLIPASRRDAKQRRTLIRRWILCSAGYGVLVLLFGVFCHARWGGDTDKMSQHLQSTRDQITSDKGRLSALQIQVAEARSTFHANHLVMNKPDWSRLMALLAQSVTDQIVLRRCRLDPVASAAKPEAVAGGPQNRSDDTSWTMPRSYNLRLAGLGRSQSSVSQFVVRLEKTGLFNRVTLRQTRREPIRQVDAVAFELACELGDELVDQKSPVKEKHAVSSAF